MHIYNICPENILRNENWYYEGKMGNIYQIVNHFMANLPLWMCVCLHNLNLYNLRVACTLKPRSQSAFWGECHSTVLCVWQATWWLFHSRIDLTGCTSSCYCSCVWTSCLWYAELTCAVHIFPALQLI